MTSVNINLDSSCYNLESKFARLNEIRSTDFNFKSFESFALFGFLFVSDESFDTRFRS
jgi:hypothetical protein